MELTLPVGTVRPFLAADAPSLARHADDRRVWLNLRDRFPHPYGLGDAETFIAAAGRQSPPTVFAIVVDGAAVGGIGFERHADVERVSAELGYWLGAAYWNRGIATAAVGAVTRHAFRQHADLERLYALPFAWNAASARVLEKAGYRLEGRLRRAAIKDGRVTDQLLYAILRDEVETGPPPPRRA
ncbi:MAG: GNAT family N-acetyltransferase [Vicinamibacterales bacterium]